MAKEFNKQSSAILALTIAVVIVGAVAAVGAVTGLAAAGGWTGVKGFEESATIIASSADWATYRLTPDMYCTNDERDAADKNRVGKTDLGTMTVADECMGKDVREYQCQDYNTLVWTKEECPRTSPCVTEVDPVTGVLGGRCRYGSYGKDLLTQ